MPWLPRRPPFFAASQGAATEAPSGDATDAAPAPVTAARRRRPRVIPMWVLLHRWVSLVTGIVLLIVVLSGAALVYQPEIHRFLNSELYDTTPTATPISQQEAVAVVNRELPDFGPVNVFLNRGVYEVHEATYASQAHVDPSSGRLLGVFDGGGIEGTTFRFLENLHLCGLTCEGEPGYVPFLTDTVPFISDPDFPLIGNEELTWGGFILGLSAVVLLFLAISGIVLWWPGIKRMARGFTVRRRKGAYAVNYDLHKVVGIVAIPFLVMWAVTGASYEFKQVSDIWYWMLPGDAPPDEEEVFASTPVEGQSVSMNEARAIAERTLPGRDVMSVSVPDTSDETSYYSVWLQDGIDPYEYGAYPGDAEVSVDRYSGRAEITYQGRDDAPVSEVLMSEWNYPIHSGFPVNGWWRSLWLLFGLTPLLLAITGVVTWLMRRRRGRRGRNGPDLPAASS